MDISRAYVSRDVVYYISIQNYEYIYFSSVVFNGIILQVFQIFEECFLPAGDYLSNVFIFLEIV